MAEEVRLKATKDLKGFAARRVDGYKTRRLKAGDEFYVNANLGAFIVDKLKMAEYNREAGNITAPPKSLVKRAAEVTPQSKTDDLSGLRAEYTRVVGKRPFNGWDAETLQEKIDAAR